MKNTHRQRKYAESANSDRIQNKEKGFSESEKMSFRLSLYSMTLSNSHSTLNTLASVALVANSALAFAAISKGWLKLFSFGTGIYVLSLILYVFAACSNFIAKNTVRNIKLNNEKEILEIIDKIDEKYKEYAIFTSIVIILSIFFLFIVEYNILR